MFDWVITSLLFSTNTFQVIFMGACFIVFASDSKYTRSLMFDVVSYLSFFFFCYHTFFNVIEPDLLFLIVYLTVVFIIFWAENHQDNFLLYYFNDFIFLCSLLYFWLFLLFKLINLFFFDSAYFLNCLLFLSQNIWFFDKFLTNINFGICYFFLYQVALNSSFIEENGSLRCSQPPRYYISWLSMSTFFKFFVLLIICL